jgi:hypothetical protein
MPGQYDEDRVPYLEVLSIYPKIAPAAVLGGGEKERILILG